MASIYKRARLKPIPTGAEIIERRGKRWARWIDPKTQRKRKAPLSDDGNKIVVEFPHYIISYFDENGQRVEESSGTSDRDAAETLAGKLKTDVMLRRKGIVDPKADRYSQANRQLLNEHIDDLHNALAAKGDTKQHCDQTTMHVRLIIAACKAEHISDLAPSTVQAAIAEQRDAGRSLRTCNSYLRSMKTFSRWLVRDGRAAADALAHLQAYNQATDQRYVRRDLLPDELIRLIQAAMRGPDVLAISGEDRAMAYCLAAGTGFRADELRSLTPESFDLNADPATVTVRAGHSKRRRNDVQEIRADLAELLRPWLDTKPAGQQVLPLHKKTAKMLRTDLAAARRSWLEEAPDPREREAREKSDFLCAVDHMGRVADFHALRHTYITMLGRSNAPLKAIQEMARHSTPTLTMHYSHARLHDRTAALDALPSLKPTTTERAALRATGTDGNPKGESTTHDQSACQQKSQQSDGEQWTIVASSGEHATGEKADGPDSKPLRREPFGKSRRRKARDDEVGRGGVEPPTHGFSVRCSTN